MLDWLVPFCSTGGPPQIVTVSTTDAEIDGRRTRQPELGPKLATSIVGVPSLAFTVLLSLAP